MLEENFQRSLALSRGDYGIFTSSPLSTTLVGVCALAVAFGAIRPAFAALLEKRRPRVPVAPAESSAPTDFTEDLEPLASKETVK